jgi:hypothetical protein
MALEQSEPSKVSIHDLVGAALGVIAAAILITSPWNVDTSGPEPFYKGPLIFPIMALGLIIGASLPSLWRVMRRQPGARGSSEERLAFPYKTLWTLLLLIAFLVGIPWLGLEACVLLFLLAASYLLGHRTTAKGILLPLVMTFLIWFVFKRILGVFFPAPRLWEVLMG